MSSIDSNFDFLNDFEPAEGKYQAPQFGSVRFAESEAKKRPEFPKSFTIESSDEDKRPQSASKKSSGGEESELETMKDEIMAEMKILLKNFKHELVTRKSTFVALKRFSDSKRPEGIGQGDDEREKRTAVRRRENKTRQTILLTLLKFAHAGFRVKCCGVGAT